MIEEEFRKLVSTSRGTTDLLTLKLAGGDVHRYHTERDMRLQTVAEHSWRVAVILHHLWPEHTYLLAAALYHDVAEGLLGDTPAPMKRIAGIKAALTHLEDKYETFLGVGKFLHDLTEEDQARLKVADYLELTLTCRAQLGAGAARIVAVGTGYVNAAAAKLPAAERERVQAILAEPWRIDSTGQDHPFGYEFDDG